jgi:hypothetical protein
MGTREGNPVNPGTAEWESRLSEYSWLRADAGGNELALLEAALFVEEATGILIRDDEIIPENLGSIQAIRRFVAARRERA